MARIRPFRAVRPAPGQVRQVAAPPYDVLSIDEAREIIRSNPGSFLRVTRAEAELTPGTDPYSAEVYTLARRNLEGYIEAGVLLREQSECLYIYSLTVDGRTQLGLAACASVEDYASGVIKRHELTRADKEEDRTRHIEYCKAHTGLVFMAYRADAGIRRRLNEWTANNAALYDFTVGAVEHRLWRIDDAGCIDELVRCFSDMTLYIADGHHRNASAERVARRMGAARPEAVYYPVVMFADSDLRIMGYNRLVKDLNGLTRGQFLDRLGERFEVSAAEVEGRHSFGLYMGGGWQWLTAKPEALAGKDAVGLLDVSVLQDEVLSAILGIGDPRLDKRIDFVGGIHGRAELMRRVDSGEMALAFEMYPTSMAELMAIADDGRIMPPKSTWFEPKLLSGLLVHEI